MDRWAAARAERDGFYFTVHRNAGLEFRITPGGETNAHRAVARDAEIALGEATNRRNCHASSFCREPLPIASAQKTESGPVECHSGRYRRDGDLAGKG